MDTMDYAITCIAGVESLVKNEVARCGYQVTQVQDRLIFFTGDRSALARMNLWSRVGNKVYVELARGPVSDFDALFSLISGIDWSIYAGKHHPIDVDAVSLKSILSSVPAIQKTSKKAIMARITGSKDRIYFENDALNPREILVFLNADTAHILLNTSGEALHKRGYRESLHQAPIKESLAAALVLLSGWRYDKPFYDFFCGSGTILIEAALIAKNKAPGSLGRRFAFEEFGWYDPEYLREAKREAESKQYASEKHSLYGSDCDPQSIAFASAGAQKAGVADCVSFEVKDFTGLSDCSDLDGTMVSNPPYGLRLGDDDLSLLYRNIAKLFSKNASLGGGIITSFEEFDRFIPTTGWKKRKLYNGNEKCYFYKRELASGKGGK